MQPEEGSVGDDAGVLAAMSIFSRKKERYGFILEVSGTARLSPEQRNLLKLSFLAKEHGNIIRANDLRNRARKLGGIRAVKYAHDGNVWVEMMEGA